MNAKPLNKNFQIVKSKNLENGIVTYQQSKNNHATVWTYRDRKGRIHHDVEAAGERSWQAPFKMYLSLAEPESLTTPIV